jgi:hypothetical protein
VPRGESSALVLAAGQQYGRNRRSLGNVMRQASRLIGFFRSARLQHAMVVLFTLLVSAYGAIALPAIWRGSDRILDHMAATIGVALLIGVGVLVLTAGGLAWLLPGTLDRQQRSLTGQSNREEELREQGRAAAKHP